MRVVLADSDREFLEVVQSFLWDRGHEAEIASDALECISILREFVPDVLVLDGDLLWGGSDGVLALMDEDLLLFEIAVVLTAEGDIMADELVALSGDAGALRLAKAVEIVLPDQNVDAVLVVFAPQAMSKPTDAAKAVIEVAKKSFKPVLTSWMGGLSMRKGIELFNAAGIPTYGAPEQAVRAFTLFVMAQLAISRPFRAWWIPPPEITIPRDLAVFCCRL